MCLRRRGWICAGDSSKATGTRSLNSQSEKFDWMFFTKASKHLPLNSRTTTDTLSVVEKLDSVQTHNRVI